MSDSHDVSRTNIVLQAADLSGTTPKESDRWVLAWWLLIDNTTSTLTISGADNE